MSLGRSGSDSLGMQPHNKLRIRGKMAHSDNLEETNWCVWLAHNLLNSCRSVKSQFEDTLPCLGLVISFYKGF